MSGAAASTSTGAVANPNNQNFAMPYGSRKMPKPGEKNAPTFDVEKPEELGRFFDRMEDWFAEDGYAEDDEKKKRIVKYLDADSEIQWKAFSKFANGTFAEFKAQVMASYPKAEDVLKGSVTALKKRIKKLGKVEVEDRDELLSLIRIMTAEVEKLKRITPPIHTNRELVDLFLTILSSDFARRIAQKLSVRRLIDTKEAQNATRNPEDMYDIEEVMEMAKQTAMESSNPFGKFLWSAERDTSDTSVKLEEAVARLTDTINLQSQHNRQVDQRLASLQSFMSQPKPSTTGNYVTQPNYGRTYGNPLGQTNAMNSPECFYCKGDDGHRIPDCQDAIRHLEKGWVKKVDGRLRLPDGSPIPRDGNKSMKEVVEGLLKSRPGLIPMSKIQDKSSLFQETGMSSYTQTQGQSSEEMNMRALLEVVHKLGPDRVLKMINTHEQTEEIDEWNQNFD